MSLRASESLMVRRPRSDLQTAIDALVFSFADAVVFLVLARILAWAFPVAGSLKTNPFFEMGKDGSVNLSTLASFSGCLLMVVALLVGLAHGAIAYRGSYHWLMREKLEVTRQTGQVGVWLDVFSEPHAVWVRIGLPDGSIVQGWPKYYSDDPEVPEVYLENVTIYSPAGEVKEEMKGFLITRNFKIQWIAFYGGDEYESGEAGHATT